MKKILLLICVMIFSANMALAVDKLGKWSSMPIKVYIEEDRNAYLAKKAFGDWESESKKLVSFTYVDSEEEADIKLKFVEKTYEDHESSVGLTYPMVDDKGYFRSAIIEIAKYTEHQNIKLSNFMLTKILRHEIGHALGLVHSDVPYSIMNTTTNKCLDITKEDLKTLQAIYNEESR